MSKILTVFIDGLKPESIEHMPFLKSLNRIKRIKTEWGFSNTCHASMYSGVYPNLHEIWYLWKYSEKTSPYRWMRSLGLNKIPDIDFLKYFSYRLVKLLNKNNTSFAGIPFNTSTPFKYWPFIDTSEKKFWDEEGYIKKYPSIFDILRKNNMPFDVIGMVKKGAGYSSKIVEKYSFPSEVKPWTYFFIGDIDPMSHVYGQDSEITIERLKYIDKVISEKYKYLISKNEDVTFMLFSDHGHVKVTESIELRSLFREKGFELNDYIHVVDSTFARFWIRNNEEGSKIRNILDKINIGYILDETHYKKYNLEMPDNRYGDIIFAIDPPKVFSKQFSPFGKLRGKKPDYSMHGYNPEFKDMDGVLVTNKDLISEEYIKLQDILPSHLSILGVELPSYICGNSFWQ